MKNYLRNFLLASPLKHYLVFRYEFNFTPAQLGFLCECLTKTEPVPGNILEIGCAQGNTTVFLNRHLDTLKSTKSYTCVDTFTGFTERDIAWEVNQRNKESNMFSGFQLGKKMFDVTLAFNNVKRVTAIQNDILNVNADKFGKVSFALLDVDLYYPISVFLPKLWEILSPGGIIVVDDCMQNNPYDGACQAYLEFFQSTNLEPDIRFGKLGIIQKPF